ncbi:hypothetical protein I549_4373 [Mycobacterium avium subsp. avium 2285 (R)]|nr:hypothetical protein I549_4373 [Mycobacterium avium subsp. avium 2285 (R)]
MQTAIDASIDGANAPAGAERPNDDDADKPGGVEFSPSSRVNRRWGRITVFLILPLVAMALAAGNGYLYWRTASADAADRARIESTAAARDSTVALLSYQPDKVDQQLAAARELLTGPFKESYTSLTNDVVIPAAKEKQVSAVATVPAAASVSANAHQAVAMVFVNQTTTVGDGAPTGTSSVVKVTLDDVDGHWLISGFDPI